MSQSKKDSFALLTKAWKTLEAGLSSQPKNPLEVAGVIKTFEFTYEMFWKTLKVFLADEGIETLSPRTVFSAALQNKYIFDETVWLEIMKDRNKTSHAYDELLAQQIQKRISENYKAEFSRLYEHLKSKL